MTVMQLTKISIPLGILTLLAFIFGGSSRSIAQKADAQTVSFPTKSITPAKSVSSPVISATPKVVPEVALANHLKQKGAKMYATYWCPVCRWQERQFGTQAANTVKSIRIECDPRGKNAQTPVCDRNNIRAFPTWQIDGKIYEGGIPLKELADISGYTGPRNFSSSGN